MFVTDEMIEDMAARYGSPATPSFEIETSLKELEFIRSTQKAGRNHDVTIYAVNRDETIDNKAVTDSQVAVIAKHFYPEKLYRAPSGGLNPGESFETGIAREMAEEIGCEIQLERFLVHTSVKFVNTDSNIERHTPPSEQVLQPPLSSGDDLRQNDIISGRQTSSSAPVNEIKWRSFVFLARIISGDFQFTDKHEIKEVRLANWSEFDLFSSIMRESDIGGLHYRAQLHEAVLEVL